LVATVADVHDNELAAQATHVLVTVTTPATVALVETVKNPYETQPELQTAEVLTAHATQVVPTE